MNRGLERVLLGGILAFQVLMGAGYALGTPAWETPDEPAHYNYIRHIADTLTFPVLQVGDYNFDELERLKAARFPPSMPIDGVRYEFHQPPLYYLLMAPLYKVTTGLPLAQQVVALRLVSVLLGALVLLVAYGITRTVFAKESLLALAVPAFVAVIPMHTAMSAATNNDTLSELLLAVILWLALLRLRDAIPTRRYVVLGGVILGLGLLTKVTVYVGIVLFAAAELGRWVNPALRQGPAPAVAGAGGFARLIGRVARLADFAALAAIGLIPSAWWFVRNAWVYGNLDILGRQRHDLVVLGQPRTVWGWEAVQHFVVVSFRSFWAQFGWMGIPVDERIYQGLAVLSLLAAVGLALFLWREGPGMPALHKWELGLLALLFVLILGGMVQYNLDYIQAQGRYLFPATVSIAVGFALGLRHLAGRAWLSPLLMALGVAWLTLRGAGRAFLATGVAATLVPVGLRRAAPRLVEPVLLALALGCLGVINVYCLVFVIVPYF